MSYRLSAALVARYLFFLQRRPISRSNTHYLGRRLAGLRSLIPELERAPDGGARAAAARLRRLEPSGLGREASRIVADLMPSVPEHPPEGYLVVQGAPGPEVLEGVDRALLIFGPGIGVGDEILCFPLPLWSGGEGRRSITVLSAYEGLWRNIRGVDRTCTYTRHDELRQALLGEGAWQGFDLVMLVDFESPGLVPCLSRGLSTGKYVEIGLGERKASFVDGRRRRIYHLSSLDPYARGFYSALGHLARGLGLVPSPRSRAGLRPATPPRRSGGSGPRTLVVCPFSSKYDPSALYWSRLVEEMLSELPSVPTRIRIDPGPNRETEGFAESLARSLSARLEHGFRCELVRPRTDEGRKSSGSVGLDRMMEVLETGPVVLAADSYAAHAAPVFGCLTLVLTGADVDGWRVPWGPSFYFDGTDRRQDVAKAMGRVLAAGWQPGAVDGPGDPRGTREGRDLAAASARLAALWDADRTADLDGPWQSWEAAFRAFWSTVSAWRSGAGVLFADADYERFLAPLPRLDDTDGPSVQEAFELHRRDLFESWENTNLCKFLALPEGEKR